MDDSTRDLFFEEAHELLENLEKAILELEKDTQDMDQIHRAFRSLHTLKGSASMMGMEELTHFTHQAENLFAALRDEEVELSQDIIQWSLNSRDILETLIHQETPDPANRAQIDMLLAQCEQFQKNQKGVSKESVVTTASEEGLRTYKVSFSLDSPSMEQGLNPLNLLRELSQMGAHLTMGDVSQLPDITELNPDHLYLKWETILNTTTPQEDIEDIFIFAPDQDIFRIEEIGHPGEALPYKRLGEILQDRGIIKQEDLKNAISPNEFLGETLVNLGLIKESQLQSALKEQRFVQKINEQQKIRQPVSSIKVKTQRLDSLMLLIGEFVTLHLNLAHVSKEKEDKDFLGISERMDSLLRELRQLSMEMLMIPIGNLFSKYKRPIRDIAQQCGKQVQLITSGEETEFDRNIHEGLSDPLLHLIRNAIDHGIEMPDIREKKGKPPQGTLILEALYKGTSVLLNIKDDGAGIDPSKIRKKAEEKGLIQAGDSLSDQEVLELIFEPGFSTAVEVSNVSGRGVGMDVVKKSILQLRGKVSISSELGKGTEIQLKLPLTLASTDSLLITANGIYYLVPLNFVQECLTQRMKTKMKGTVKVRDELISYVDMRYLFANPGDSSPTEEEEINLVIVEDEGIRMALIADEIRDIHQSVIKPLNTLLKNRSFLAGTDILGDGSPAFVLEMQNLISMVENVKES